MDPNLLKIKDYHINSIRRGIIWKAEEDARSYLEYILSHHYSRINKELHEFRKNITKENNNGFSKE